MGPYGRRFGNLCFYLPPWPRIIDRTTQGDPIRKHSGFRGGSVLRLGYTLGLLTIRSLAAAIVPPSLMMIAATSISMLGTKGRRKFEKFLREVGADEEDEGVIDVESK